jgi:hypothetical protein
MQGPLPISAEAFCIQKKMQRLCAASVKDGGNEIAVAYS